MYLRVDTHMPKFSIIDIPLNIIFEEDPEYKKKIAKEIEEKVKSTGFQWQGGKGWKKAKKKKRRKGKGVEYDEDNEEDYSSTISNRSMTPEEFVAYQKQLLEDKYGGGGGAYGYGYRGEQW